MSALYQINVFISLKIRALSLNLPLEVRAPSLNFPLKVRGNKGGYFHNFHNSPYPSYLKRGKIISLPSYPSTWLRTSLKRGNLENLLLPSNSIT